MDYTQSVQSDYHIFGTEFAMTTKFALCQKILPVNKLCAHQEILMLFCHLLIFFKINFFKKFFQEYHMSNSLDPDKARHFVGPHLGPTCLQRLPSDGTRRQRVKLYKSLMQILW